MPETKQSIELASQVVSLFESILMKHSKQEAIPPGLLNVDGLEKICNYLMEFKTIIQNFSAGQFDCQIQLRGSTAGYLKALQSNIRHLAWQCQNVAAGDFSQRVEFMGELSDAFNVMTQGLIRQHEVISQKQEELLYLANELKDEIKKKEEVGVALKISEQMYREKSLRDSLTGLYNRGYFFEAIASRIEYMKRGKNAHACVAMLDIDHFKKFNDTYGHLCGDVAIKMVANAILGTLRKGDVACRYGGEEFVLFLHGIDLDQSITICERIRLNIANQPCLDEGGDASVTVSIGVSWLDPFVLTQNDSGVDILHRVLGAADVAMYKAKHSGRNQVRANCVWGHQGGPVQHQQCSE